MKNLRAIRKARGYTREAFALALWPHLKTMSALQKLDRYERCQNDPDQATRNAIADLLGVTLDQLAGRAPFEVPATVAS